MQQLTTEERREKILALIGAPVRAPLRTKHIGAVLLREIVLEAQRTLRNPDAYCFNDLCTDAHGKGINIWSSKAHRFSEMGHIYRATRAVVCSTHRKMLKKMRLENITNYIVALVDAQVRYLEGEMTLVTYAMTYGRRGLVTLFGRIAERLAEGDSALIAPPIYKEAAEKKEFARTVFFHPDVLPSSLRPLKKPRRCQSDSFNRRPGRPHPTK